MSRESFIKVLWGQNRNMSILTIVLILTTVSVYLVQTQILDKQLFELRTEVRDRQQSLRSLQQQKNTGSMPVTALKRIETDLVRFQNLVPPASQLSEFIGELFSFADSSKLDINQISYSPELDDELGLLRYGLSFSVSGKYRQLKSFIHQLEGAKRILIIDDISLSGGERGNQKNSEVTLQIKIKTFFRGDEK